MRQTKLETMTALKTLIFLLVVPGTVVFLVPSLIMRASESPLFDLGVGRFLAVAAWAAGVGILVWCGWDFTVTGRGTPAPIDPPKELVVKGLYRVVRNPMYLGGTLVLLGHLIWFPSLWLLLYAGFVVLVFHLFVLLYEEPTLAKQFGESYLRYRRRVPRWIPRRPPD